MQSGLPLVYLSLAARRLLLYVRVRGARVQDKNDLTLVEKVDGVFASGLSRVIAKTKV